MAENGTGKSEMNASSRAGIQPRTVLQIIGTIGLVLLAGALMSLCVSVLLWAILLGPAPDYPSDEEMISRYRENVAEFERLKRMMVTEAEITRVSDEVCRLADQKIVTGAENERCREYLALCDDLGIESAAIGSERLILYVGSWGGAMGGSVLGYEYTNDPPLSGLVTDTRRLGEGWAGGIAYHHIEGNWYIFLMDN